MITVKAKVTAGYSQIINAEIVEGQEYTIEEHQFSDDLYERPAGFTPPWNRTEGQPQGVAPTKSKSKGGTE